MKIVQHAVITLICCIFLTLPCLAESDDVGASANQETTTLTREIQPLFSRYAKTVTRWTLRGGARFFKDVELQEADEFDGTSLDIELTAPLSERFQFRFHYPFYTDGEARITESNNGAGNGKKVDINGNGGTLDFPCAIIDYQFVQAAAPGEFNMAIFAGAGYVMDPLDVEDKETGELLDFYNHRGAVFLFGLKLDQQINSCWSVVTNLGGRYYWDSDDLNPNNQDDDKFWLLDASGSLIYTPQDAWLYPVLEIVYQGEFDNYNNLQVVPQIIIPVCSHFDLNLGVSIGILDDGPSLEGHAQMTLRY